MLVTLDVDDLAETLSHAEHEEHGADNADRNARAAARPAEMLASVLESSPQEETACMSDPAYIRSLYETIEGLPDGMVGEIINGQLYTQPRPSGPHALTVSNLGADLITPFGRGRGGPGGWWIIFEPEVHLKRDTEVVVPDIAGWRRERMPQVPSDQRFEVVPDWVCEVLSPSTTSRDRELKMPLYAAYGVRHAWLIDPIARVPETFELRDGASANLARFGNGEPISAPPFESISLESPWS